MDEMAQIIIHLGTLEDIVKEKHDEKALRDDRLE
jgi:hypothetical protein